VQNWCANQQPPWSVYRGDGGSEQSVEQFVELLDGRDFDDLATSVFCNRQRTSSRAGILKAEAVYRFAKVLHDFEVNTFGDTEDTSRNDRVEQAIRKIPGQKSGISFSYFLMLAGSEGFVKADRMICRFVAEAMRQPATPAIAQRLVLDAASNLGLSPRLLDYAIWNYQRSRSASTLQKFAEK
jgi:hypothetical protein